MYSLAYQTVAGCHYKPGHYVDGRFNRNGSNRHKELFNFLPEQQRTCELCHQVSMKWIPYKHDILLCNESWIYSKIVETKSLYISELLKHKYFL